MPTVGRFALLLTVLSVRPIAATDDSGNPSIAETLHSSGDDVEEVVVTAEPLEKGEVPTGTIIAQTYNVRDRGMWLYEERRYREALPLLLVAAKRGFKWPQAMAGDIYLHGRGDVARSLEAGIGWLGVAAAPQTEPMIDSYYREAMQELPSRMREAAEATVDRYRRQWASAGWRVSCRRDICDSATPVVSSLRLNRRLRCTFIDEVPICRPAYLDPIFGPPIGGQQMQWECAPVGQQEVSAQRLAPPSQRGH